MLRNSQPTFVKGKPKLPLALLHNQIKLVRKNEKDSPWYIDVGRVAVEFKTFTVRLDTHVTGNPTKKLIFSLLLDLDEIGLDFGLDWIGLCMHKCSGT